MQMKNMVIIAAVLAIVSIGIWYAFGGKNGKQENQFGEGTGVKVTAIGDIQQAPEKYLGQVVTVEGEMTKECPSSGCWWYVKDGTGEIRADSFGSGFALPLNKEGKHIRTTGKLVKGEGGELQIGAIGAELH